MIDQLNTWSNPLSLLTKIHIVLKEILFFGLIDEAFILLYVR